MEAQYEERALQFEAARAKPDEGLLLNHAPQELNRLDQELITLASNEQSEQNLVLGQQSRRLEQSVQVLGKVGLQIEA